MSRKQNPYHLWLGLPAELASPNFFQLLDIAPDAADNKQIAASARTNAQQLLDRLKKVPVKSDGEKAIREKLKARVVKAHKTLSDPTKRKQYAEALAAKHSISGILPTVASPPTPVAPPPSTPEPSSNTVANIPQAIPLAMPIDSAPPQGTAPPAADDLFAGLSDEETVSVRPVRARGKRGSIVPLVVTLLAVAVIGGLVSLLVKYNNVFDLLAQRDQNAINATAPAVPDPGEMDAESDPEPLRAPSNFEEFANSQSQRNRDILGEKGTTAADETSEGSMSASKDVGENKEGSSEKTPDDEAEISAADRAAGASVTRVAANMVRAALVRRDIPAARIANQRINRLAGSDFLDAQTKSLLEKERSQNEEMIAHLEVFLTQLQKAADEMPGGQDIKVGKLVMALVDASPTEVTVRRAGRNEVIPYTDLPTSVAIALGDQGSKESIPKWNMAKAADLIIQSQYNPTLQEKARPFLTQSISDGYDIECEVISDYADTMWQEEYLPKRSDDPTLDQVAAELKEFRADNGYKNPKLVKPDMAPALTEELMFSLAPELKQRVARLSDAVAIATQQKNFDALLVTTGELYKNSYAINVADTVVKPINRIMRADMTAVEARHLVHTIIAMVKQHSTRRSFNKKAKPELVRHAQTLVEEFQFSELAPKVNQLAE